MPKTPSKPKARTAKSAKPKKPATPKKPKAKSPAVAKASKQARQIIELMLKEMRAGMTDTSDLSIEEWECLFGAKQSMVVNLQKLIQTLVILPDGDLDHGQKVENLPPMTMEEVKILKGWLGDQPDV